MGQDNTGKPSTQNPSSEAPSSQDSPSQDSPSQDQPIADDLLHAAHAVPPADMVANVELTLDHLSTTVDLFDIPPFDYGDTGYSDTGGGGDVG